MIFKGLLRKQAILNIYLIMIVTILGITTCSKPSLSRDFYRFERMWPTLKQPWYFYAPHGIAVDDEGYVYVSDIGHNRIQRFTHSGQFVGKWGSFGTGDGQFRGPYGIAVDSSGFVYVADQSNHRIQVFTSAGQFVRKWGSMGEGKGQFQLPYGITVDGSGLVYVADTSNNRIQVFTSAGEFVTVWGGFGTGDGQFMWPRSIAVYRGASSGLVYVADTYTSRIQVFTPDGQFVTKWGSKGSGDGQFFYPYGITVDSSGLVYVADSYNNRIQVFTPDGQFVTKWGTQGTGNGQFYDPRGITVDSKDSVYVADFRNDRIQIFTGAGEFMTVWGSLGSGEGEFIEPYGISMYSGGSSTHVYVADSGNHRIQVFTSAGEFVRKWGSLGEGDGEFDSPHGIAVSVDSSGHVYVADTKNNRIQVFTSAGEFVRKWGSKGSGEGEFDWPRGIAVDTGSGRVYVADTFNNRIQVFTKYGQFVTKWGSSGSGDGEFSTPHGIAVDTGSGQIYVADTEANRIQVFTPDGEFVTKWGDKGSGEGEFGEPYGIAVDNSGFVYVADTGSHPIQLFTGTGQFVAKFGDFGSSPGEFNHIRGIGVTTEGGIYVADSGNHRIQAFRRTDLSEGISKAVVVAGGGPYQGNDIWNATQISTHFAYRTLTYQGFTKETIYYLFPDPNLDLDDNGAADDVDAEPTNTNLKYAITEWATVWDEDPNTKISDLVLYFTDHGGIGTFRMNEIEILHDTNLRLWIDKAQESIDGRVIFISDACSSGSFLCTLIDPVKERILVASASPDEPAIFLSQGAFSFSNLFWTHIFNGQNIRSAFSLAKDAIGAYQTPLLDDCGTCLDPNDDGALAAAAYIGTGSDIAGDAPQLSAADANMIDHSTLLISASGVTDRDGISRVWAIIRPPDYFQNTLNNPLVDLPSVPLIKCAPTVCDPNKNIYKGIYDGLNIEGMYYITIYAQDREGNTSMPELLSVNVENPRRRKAVIIAGYSASGYMRQVIEENTKWAYGALMIQGYTSDGREPHLDDLYLMSNHTSLTGWDAMPTLANIDYAVGTWAAQDTQDLVLYIIGEGRETDLQINPDEVITAPWLGNLLDSLQNNINQGNNTIKVTLIADADYSGSLLPPLSSPGNERIVITSTRENQRAIYLFDGYISFSSFFWQRVLNGTRLKDAFSYAYSALWQFQTPVMDADGDGQYNTDIDPVIVGNYTIGFGIMFCDDPPIIGSIMPDKSLEGDEVSIVWVENVTTTGTIDKVWAVVKYREYPMGEPYPPVTLELIPGPHPGRYWALCTGLSLKGIYNISVYAKDAEGSISLPKEAVLYQYEGDNTPGQANIAYVNGPVEHHNIHLPGDQDWFIFYAGKGFVYEIKVNNVGEYFNPVIDLYSADGNSVMATPPFDSSGRGEPEIMPWICEEDGVYSIMVRDKDPNIFGAGICYDFRVYRPWGPPFPGAISGAIKDAIDNTSVGGAQIITDIGITAKSFPSGFYFMGHWAGGPFDVKAMAKGYIDSNTLAEVREGETITIDFYLMPIDTDSDKLPDLFETGKTLTDPNNPDTDNDGIADDLEDPDHDCYSNYREYRNGSEPLVSNIYLTEGLNLFGYPLQVPGGYNSYDLINALGGNDEIQMIVKLDTKTKKFLRTTYDPYGLPAGDMFDIVSGEGYIVYMKVDKSVNLAEMGVDPGYSNILEIPLAEGQNIISMPGICSGYYTSYDLISDPISQTEICEIKRYNKITGRFESTASLFDKPSGVDFRIADDEGYLVHVK